MSTSAEHDRGWVLVRSLAFLAVHALVFVFAVLGAFAPCSIMIGVRLGLDQLRERLRPPAPIDPATDLRAFYLVVTS